ncbi:MAG TPA: hypothetical protein VF823_00415 [Anaerolineales bacterium]
MSNYLTRLKVPARPQRKKPESTQTDNRWNEIKPEFVHSKQELNGDENLAKTPRIPTKLPVKPELLS